MRYDQVDVTGMNRGQSHAALATHISNSNRDIRTIVLEERSVNNTIKTYWVIYYV